MTLSTSLQPGQHYIGYAYPSSPNACALGQGEKGCYYVRVPAETVAHATYKGCLAHLDGMGTNPNRWSMDHHANAHMLTAE